MWRRFADIPYTLLVFGIFMLELVGLGTLIWTFALRTGQLVPDVFVEQTLIAATAITALGLLLLTAYILAYHVLSVPRERRRRQRLETWTDRWFGVLFSTEPTPTGRLGADATEAAFEIRERLKGSEGKEFSRLLEELRLGEPLLDRLRSFRLTTRLSALDGLAKARLPGSIGPLMRAMLDPNPVARFMAGRAVARTMSEMPPDARRDEVAVTFARALELAVLPPGASGEILLLLEDAAPVVLAALFLDGRLPAPLVRAALDVVGRHRLREFTDEAVSRITYRDREVRAAALRALARLGIAPPQASDPIVIALNDDTEFVRVQAARAAAYLPPEVAVPVLQGSMGDSSWWVRRASAESLLKLGPKGIGTLWAAANKHPDVFAGDMAAQVLLDAGIKAPQLGSGLSETA
ncbi:MAG TPA: HEAT repeat domain-containing protein [Actinomycetota bacterium]|nr:HEAT repeat domain-containing protein [Actinomycetota bacterium]